VVQNDDAVKARGGDQERHELPPDRARRSGDYRRSLSHAALSRHLAAQ
jgi:hypothetical protein